MKYKGHTLRHELKYLINYADYYSIAAAAGQILYPDENSGDDGYLIRSMYFDDIYDSAYLDKQAGIFRRRKHRIRIYNYSDEVIKFEIKDKFDNYISKLSASITREQCEGMMHGNFDFMLNSDKQALRAGFIDARTHILRPAVVVDYNREAFVLDEGNVRLTFDSKLRAGFCTTNIFDADMPTLPAIEPDMLIMEVKFDDFLPKVVQKLLAPVNSKQSSQSKYVMCRDAQKTYYRKERHYDKF